MNRSPKTRTPSFTMALHLFLFAGILAVSACQSAPSRSPTEDYRAADDFMNRGVADIVVLPIENRAERRSGESEGREVPLDDMRQMVREYLIQQKNYAAPKGAWIDGQRERGETLDTDGLLRVSVNQWDTSALERRGVIYVSASFELKSPSGDDLWHYRCDDMQLMVAGPHGAERGVENVRDGVRLLTETALSRMPRK